MINIITTNKFIIKNCFLFTFILLFNSESYSQILSAEKIYDTVKDAIVVILGYDKSDELISQGSGVVLNDKEYIITNYHILSGCVRFEIMHGDNEIPFIDIAGYDVDKDIVIININDKNFPSIRIGDVHSLKVGQRVYAIGNPMGLENTISEGIISGLRSYDSLKKNYIQITASISPGSSGGAVVNEKGELIGISTATFEDGQNLNFAIPIDEILTVKKSNLSIEGFRELLIGMKWNMVREISLRADSLYENQKYAEAIVLYSNSLDELGKVRSFLDSMRASHHYANMSICYYKIGNLEASYESYKLALAYDCGLEFLSNTDLEDISAAFYNRGTMIGKLGDYVRAIEDFNKAIEINPYFAEAYYNCGLAKYNLGDINGACLYWSKAEKLGYYGAYELIKEHCE